MEMGFQQRGLFVPSTQATHVTRERAMATLRPASSALPRIASLLPSTTEIVGLLGLSPQLVAVTHEVEDERQSEGGCVCRECVRARGREGERARKKERGCTCACAR